MALFQTEKLEMTDVDRERMNAEHVTAQLELDALKDEKRSVTSVYGTKIKALEQKIHKLATDLDAGEYEVKVDVIEEPDDARLMMRVLRKDNGREINVRPMTEVEKAAAHKRKQVPMFDASGDTERPPPNGKPAKKSRAKKR